MEYHKNEEYSVQENQNKKEKNGKSGGLRHVMCRHIVLCKPAAAAASSSSYLSGGVYINSKVYKYQRERGAYHRPIS